MSSIDIRNINNSFFDGLYKDIWRQVFPEKTTLAEVNFIIDEGVLTDGDLVLDIMCGYGRHTIEFAKRGFQVTCIDNVKEYIVEIDEIKVKNRLNIEAIFEDVLEVEIDKVYDVAICMGNSTQFFQKEDLIKLFGKINSCLKREGKFIINTWSILEIVAKEFKSNFWQKINGIYFLNESEWHFQPSRFETKSIMIDENGKVEEKYSIDFVYSIQEIELILNETGFSIDKIYSIPKKKKFSLGDPRAYIVSKKIT